MAHAQTNEWAWVGGFQTPTIAGVYGTLGVASSSNFPGYRSGPASWTDKSGGFWMFGGYGNDSAGRTGCLNDLWYYQPSSAEWTWMGGSNSIGSLGTGIYGTLGIPSASNLPACRTSASTWVDQDGNLWLFGGAGPNQTVLNDFWKYSPAANQWTWVGGANIQTCAQCTQLGVYGTQGTSAASNFPGSRQSASSWTDQNGDLWLFGGFGVGSTNNFGNLNDLWKYSSLTGQWTWVTGSSAFSISTETGVYGTIGVASAANSPGGRQDASAWTDTQGNLWLFGGSGYDSSGIIGKLNDLWEYSVTTDQWTWMRGASTYSAANCSSVNSNCDTPGVYGTLQVPSAGNDPGSRSWAATWTDKNGNLWLFGGNGLDSLGKTGYLNDLWEYNRQNNVWTWMNGGQAFNCSSVYCGMPGVYGTEGSPMIGNIPPGRASAGVWVDASGNLWLFGGVGAAGTRQQYLEDLWEFQPNLSAANVASAPVFTPAPGTYTSAQSVSITSPTPGSSIYYLINNATPASEYSVPLTVNTSETITAITAAPGYANSAIKTAIYTINFPPAPAPVFSLASGSYSTVQAVSISDTAPNAQIYYTTDGSIPTSASTLYSGPIQITVTETINAIAIAPGYTASSVTSARYLISPPISAPGTWVWMGSHPTAVYGQLKQFAADNNPGQRASSSSWKDLSGNVWLFGGNSNYRMNDLWKFDIATQEWAWMSGSQKVQQPGVYGKLGVSAANNTPGARQGAASWIGSDGRVWLFGGDGYDAVGSWSNLNDLWVFDPATNQWAWMGGNSTVTTPCYYPPGASRGGYCGVPGIYGTIGQASAASFPGSRYNAVTWIDTNGDFWLFGGTGTDSLGSPGYLNDLWRYDPKTNQWTWMAGNSTLGPSYLGQAGIYGNLGTVASANSPGGRYGAMGWIDQNGNLWLFGGHGIDSLGSEGTLNDLWKFDSSTNQWIWMGGDNVLRTSLGRPNGVTGAYGTAAPGNVPGGRRNAATWSDSSGNLWLFGGNWYTWDQGVEHYANDLWQFNPKSNMWTWFGGNGTTGDGLGTYGALGVPDLSNIPAGRTSPVNWTDGSDRLWMLGGGTSPDNAGTQYGNDLWLYQINSGSLPSAALPTFTPGTSTVLSGQQITLSDASPGASIYYLPNGATTPTLYTQPIQVAGSISLSAFAAAAGYLNSPVATANYTVLPANPPVFSLAAGTYATAQSLTITDATSGAAIYYTVDGSTPTVNSTLYNGPISITASQNVQAIAVAAGFSVSSVTSAIYSIWPSNAINEWAWMGGKYMPAVYGTLGVPSATNSPGYRYVAANWTDSKGNLWLFGGGWGSLGANLRLFNDLWEYDSATKVWTWVGGNRYWNGEGTYGTKGTPSAANLPGARDGAATWIDAAGRFWLYGGVGFDSAGASGELDDVWEFDPSTMQWTWVAGSNTVGPNFGQQGVYGTQGVAAPANTPGGRHSPATWVDKDGNFWLLGGYINNAQSVGALNDFWKFDLSTKQWAWMAGNNSTCVYGVQSGVWGSMGSFSADNIPSCRFAPSSWTDNQGNFWLFGGEGRDIQGFWGDQNSLWEYNPTTKQWAWMGGTNLIDLPRGVPPGNYGIQGNPAAGNVPAGRRNTATWKDANGNLWLMGGVATGFQGISEYSLFNDLWVFSPTANEWAWMSGTSNTTIPNAPSSEWTAVPGSNPNSRWGAASWIDGQGTFWLFAGESGDDMGDMWEYKPQAPQPVPGFAVVDLNNPAFNNAQSLQIQAGTTGTTTVNTVVSGGFNGSIALTALNLPSGITATFNPATVSGFAVSQVTLSVGLNVATGPYTLTVAGTSGGITETTPMSLTVASAPPANFTLTTAASSMTVNSGSQSTLALTVTPVYGFNSTVGFSCSGLPAGSSCSFNPSSVTPSGSAAVVQMTITAAARVSSTQAPWRPSVPGMTILAIIGLFGVGRMKRARYLAASVLMAFLLLAISSCGGGGGSGSTQNPTLSPIQTIVTVNATSSSVTHSVTFSLTVN